MELIPFSSLPDSPDHRFYSGLDELREKAPGELWRPAWIAAAKSDRWFLVTRVLLTRNAPYLRANSKWLFDRVREIQENPDGYIDIWSREHYKSTLITHAGTFHDFINDDGGNLAVGIFSHSRPIAKGFLRGIKWECEQNEDLKDLFPEIFWRHPGRESPKWSEDDGLVFKRDAPRREASVEAWGLVDGQPISKHYDILVYDDVVTERSVSTEDMIQKTNQAFDLSTHLGSEGVRVRIIGTRYHHFDTYQEIMDRGAAKPRIYPCIHGDWEKEWEPVLFSRDYIEDKYRRSDDPTFYAQMLCNPTYSSAVSFDWGWVRYYQNTPWEERKRRKNVYILVDPAARKKKEHDYTSMWVVGLGADENYYVFDVIRDRLSLTERTQALLDLERDWSPIMVAYEEYGLQSDIEHIEYVMEQYGWRFNIQPVGGNTKKEDRIARLQPLFREGRVYFPSDGIWRTVGGRRVDLVDVFRREEYEPFPVGKHDDMLDSLARILDEDLAAVFPRGRKPRHRDPYEDAWAAIDEGEEVTWMGA